MGAGGTSPAAVNPEGRKSGTDPTSSLTAVSFLSAFSKLSSDIFTTHFTCQVTLITHLHSRPSAFGPALGVSGLEPSTPNFLRTLPFTLQPSLQPQDTPAPSSLALVWRALAQLQARQPWVIPPPPCRPQLTQGSSAPSPNDHLPRHHG